MIGKSKSILQLIYNKTSLPVAGLAKDGSKDHYPRSDHWTARLTRYARQDKVLQWGTAFELPRHLYNLF